MNANSTYAHLSNHPSGPVTACNYLPYFDIVVIIVKGEILKHLIYPFFLCMAQISALYC